MSYRILAAWRGTGRAANLADHHAWHGPLPLAAYAGSSGRQRLIAAVERSGLRGRGGAGFPLARKLRAVSAAAPPIVVVNACEGEPLSGKDDALATLAPHLVLDGAVLAAHAVAAEEIVVCAHRGGAITRRLAAALAERPEGAVPIRLAGVPARYVSSEESALVNLLTTGEPRPTTKPPRPAERGVRGRPTLVSNVETLAQLALIARHGPEWFRRRGTPEDPGTTLLTVRGAVGRPGVYEVDCGTPVGDALTLAGGAASTARAVLTGGYGGAWLPLPSGAQAPLTHLPADRAAAVLGAGVLYVLPPERSGLEETARILGFLAGESAGQCGPCMFGLPSVAADMAQLAREPGADPVGSRLRRRLGVIAGRGACRHPDGAVRLAQSALRTFAPGRQLVRGR